MRKVTKEPVGKLSAKQTAELKAIKAMRDDEIDYSDAPSSQTGEWQDAVVGKFYRPIKQQLTLRIDADVVAWFKAQGSGYQTRINDLLRNAMLGKVRQ